MAMTVAEIKKEKIKVEEEISKLLKDFESSSGVRVRYLDVLRKREKEKANSPETVMYDSPMKDIETVTFEISFGE